LGHPTCGQALCCVWATILRTCLALSWGAQLADVRTCLVFALRTCVGAPNLQNFLALRWDAQLADVPCVVLGRPTCGRALCCVWAPILQGKICSYQSSSSSLSLVIPCVDVFVTDEFCVWATILRTCLALRFGAQLADVRTGLVFALWTCVVALNLWTCLALRWGAQLAMKFRVSVYDRDGKPM